MEIRFAASGSTAVDTGTIASRSAFRTGKALIDYGGTPPQTFNYKVRVRRV